MDYKRVDTHFLEASPPPITFLFPGLGDHYIDMARQLYEYEPLFCEQVDHCADLLLPLLGLDLREVVYPKRTSQHAYASLPPSEHAEPTLDLRKMLGRGEQQNDEATLRLNQTYLTHPALFVIEYALAQLWMRWGVCPQALFGYSVGEYAAACIAGVFSLQDALTLIAKRARLIQDLSPGMMLAVSLSEQAIQPLLSQDLSLAAINGPDVSVLAGPLSAIQDVERQLALMGVSNRRIQTLHAFHSHMMDPIAEEFTQLVSNLHLRPPIIPYISSLTGTWVTDQEATDPHYWARHLCQTVRFADGISTLYERGANYILLEVGPGQTLGSLARQQLVNQTRSEHVILASVRSAYTNQHDLTFLHQTLGRLWRLGVQIDWVAFYASASSNLWNEPTTCSLPNSPGQQKEEIRRGSGLSLPLVSEAPSASEQGASVYGDKSHVAHTSAHPSRRIRPALATTYVAPTSTIEQTITTMWQEVLGFEPIGIYDSFFELGGHSLSAIRLIAHLQKVFQVDIPLDTFLVANCIAELAVCVAEMQISTGEILEEEPSKEQSLAVAAEHASAFDLKHASASGQKLAQEHASSPAASLRYILPNGMVVAYQSKAETDHFYEDIFEHETYIQHGVVLKDGACVFDVGANIGLFTLFAHQKCRNATIYAFEPAPTVFELLRSNVASYGVNAKLFNIGLSNATKTSTLTFYPHSSGMSSFYADRAEEEEVLTTLIQNQILMGNADIEQVMQHSQALLKERFKSQTIVCQLQTLSDVIREHDLDCIDLLKVDVQKSELDILLGVEPSDWQKIKQVVMEVHDINGRLDQIISLLQRSGYITTVTQDDLYKGTVIYTVYAI